MRKPNSTEKAKRLLERLLQAVVVQAAQDYRFACRELRRYPHSKYARRLKKETESFFRSRDFRVYTRADGVRILKMLEKEMEAEHEKEN